MKLFSPLVVLLFMAVFCSCSKDDNSDLWSGGPAVEIRFVTNSSMAKNVATRAAQPSLDYEARITSLVLLAYPQGAGDNAAPVIKYPFSEDECAKKLAIIPLGTIVPSTTLDFYVVANCSATYSVLASSSLSEPTLSALRALVEADPKPRYNNGTLSELENGVNKPYDFAMSAYKQITTNVSGSNKPTVVEMKLNRTVARVDVDAKVSGNFAKNYPDATLDLKYANVMYYAKQGSIVEPLVSEDMAQSRANMTTTPDTLRQDNGSSELHTQRGVFRYYLYSNGDRNSSAITFGGELSQTPYDPAQHKNVLLTVVAEFDYDGKSTTAQDRKTITYKIPLEGEGLKGGFIRNVYYKVMVNIDGITEQEIRADISVADWQNVITQTVNIGG